MSKDVSLGQYYPITSSIHRLNPCLKLLIFIGFIITVFWGVSNFYGFGVLLLLLLLTIIISKVPIKSVLSSLKAIIFLVIFTAIINLFFGARKGETDPLWINFWIIKISRGVIIDAAFLALRLVIIALASGMLTLTTSPIELTDGLEILLYPLKLIKIPVHTLALIMSIALRFIPTLSEKTHTIMSAQKARGSKLDSGNFLNKIKALVPVLIPLLIGSFNIADQLGDAMDARCYTGKNRTKYKILGFGFSDIIAIIIFALCITAIILLNIFIGKV